MLRVGVPDSGGITDVIKIARLAESFGMHCEIEVNPSMGGFVEAQLLGAIKNAYFYYIDERAKTSTAHPPVCRLWMGISTCLCHLRLANKSA